ncbi:cation:proton antiporter [Aureliella helgolandensis]|uniref:K(+)/H(+) antiporter NhaP n=1 Tax=Aureliella helgolandensis TaxID=2527968 RepID=A0A518FZV7_9BACT|nr:sodium:proton antiporter [Aureliella helgolandensis]QDV21892.1 K(+)/H(+) antiporter NhaP [Aureliella helgolandensis]
MHEHLFPFFLVLVPLLGIVAQWLAWRLQVPSILLLLGLGLCLGIWISPDQILSDLAGTEDNFGPKLLFPIVSLSVAVILFEGGLTLRWNQLGDSANIVFRLITVSSVITWVCTAVMSKYMLGFSWQLAWLLGAILMVTGPTVVGPLLRQIRPNRRVSSILQWEGILIDPVGAVAAVLVFEVVGHAGHVTFFDISSIVVETLAIGIIIGCLAAVLLVLALRHYWVPDFLHGVFFLVVALASFWVSNWMQEEAGLVTVTILGICLANQNYVSVEHVLEFKEHLRVLLIGCLFIVLGSRLQLSALADIGWVGVPFVLLLVLVVRPLSVYLGTLGTKWPAKERLFVGLIAPRGIVAASVASVFGLKLAALAGGENAVSFDKAALLAPVTFMVILGTVTICGLGATPLARRLGLSDANPQGILFAGASAWVREVALALQKADIRVMLIDTNYAKVTAARMAGLSAKCGNILSEHIQDEQDLAGIGRFFAVTPSDEVNTLAAMEYTHVFSRESVYQLPSQGKSHGRWQSIPDNRRGRMLFQSDLTHHVLEQMFADGAKVKITLLTDTFDMEAFRAQHGPGAILLGAINSDGRLRIRTTQANLEPVPGDSVVAILPAVAKPVEPNDSNEASTAGLI